jgi:nitroreductase
VPFDLGQTDRLLTTTRAVRRRLDLSRPVPREVILDCIEVANQAPSGGNSQPWRWLVVDDPATRDGLAAIYRKGYGPYIAMQKAAAEAAGVDPDSAVMRSSDHLAEHIGEVPALVIPCLLTRLDERPSVHDTAGFYGSVLPAVWSFMLALRSRGLGSAFTTLHLHHEAEAAELLGIPDTVTQVAMLPVAYTVGDDFKPAVRRPAADVTYVNAWRHKAVRAELGVAVSLLD